MTSRGCAEEAFWALYATCYDALARLQSYRVMHQRVIDQLDLKSGLEVLDAGCGTGNLLAALLARQPGVQAAGLDFSPAMLRLTRRKASTASVRVHNLNETFPYRPASFDAITCVNVIYTLPDPVAVLSEFRRVLRPGGRVVLVTPLPGFSPATILADQVRRARTTAAWMEILVHIPHVVAIMLLNAIIQWRGVQGSYHFVDRATVEAWARAAGLNLVATEVVYAKQGLLAVLSRDD